MLSIVVTALGVLSWAVGFFFETVGDAQLAAFKADPANKGKVMDRGLWRYTRHPNYFGDAAVWWGLTLLALHHAAGLIGLVSAALMTWLLAKGTGAALLERSIGKRRPGYAEYVRRTSGFLPLPPRRPRSRLGGAAPAGRSSEVAFLAARYSTSLSGPRLRDQESSTSRSSDQRHPRHGVAARIRDPRDVDEDHRPRPRGRRGAPASPKPAIASVERRGPRGTRVRPVPCRRTMFGSPSNAQNITQTRPFSRRRATVSTPLPVRSR